MYLGDKACVSWAADQPIGLKFVIVFLSHSIQMPEWQLNIGHGYFLCMSFSVWFSTWFSNNSLIVNTDKTKTMLFHLNKICNLVMPKIVFKNVEISYTSEGKFLGINISNNLKWNTHTQFLCSKLNKVCCMFLSLRGDLSLSMLRLRYFTKFQSLIRYGIIPWVWERQSVKVLKIEKSVLCSGRGLHRRVL